MSSKVALGILFLVFLLYLLTPQASHALECYDIPEDDPLVCSGNGTCIATDLCDCLDGFSGDECEFPECFGKNATDPEVCSGVGECVGLNHCACGDYGGDECQWSPCSIDMRCIPLYTIDRNRDLVLSCQDLSTCSNLAYIWEQTYGDNVTGSEQLGLALVFRAYTFPRAGTYIFKLTITAPTYPTLFRWVEISVIVRSSPLLVSITGGDREVSNLRINKVEALREDPEDEDVGETFSWTCWAMGHACPNAIQSVVRAVTGSSLSLPIGVPTGTYTFEVTYSKATRTSKASVELTVVSTNIPEIAIISSFEKIIARRDLQIEASISPSSGSISTEWYVNNDLMTTNDRVKVFRKTLSLRNDYLIPGVRYTVLFKAKNDAGTASAKVTFYINELPHLGFTTITPESGVALSTAFTLEAKNS